jgi:hypothetical protein
VLRIGVLLPQTGSWHAGRTILGAAQLAINRINDDPSLLGGKRVEAKLLDSGCDAPSGTDAMAKLVADKNVVAVIGPGRAPFPIRQPRFTLADECAADPRCQLTFGSRGLHAMQDATMRAR